jgi:cation diffusion facilitator CzcD-associated flavoprotein CzcO
MTEPHAIEVASRWVQGWLDATRAGDAAAVASLFLEDGWWRDMVAVTWDLRTFHGAQAIGAASVEHGAGTAIASLTVDPAVPVTASTDDAGTLVEAFLLLETPTGLGRGIVRVRVGADGVGRAWTFLTALEDLKGREALLRHRRPQGNEVNDDGKTFWRPTLADRREADAADPEVLVVGAGQGGLMISAQLQLRGARTLCVEKNPRVGDNWRNRYDSLVLHDPVWADHMPFLDFPESWPIYTPKDKLADWLESYVDSMELTVETGVTVGESSYDEAARVWSVQLTAADGSTRTVHPQHVVLATGAVGAAVIPDIPGLDTFPGVVHHTSLERTAENSAGKKVVVIGAGASGHDVSMSYHWAGAEVTMVQRSPIYIVSQKNGIPALFGSLYSEDTLELWKSDLINSSYPYPLALEFAKPQTADLARQDAALLDGLRAAGFLVDLKEDGTDDGLMGRALRDAGGYYINVGASELIVEGEIKVAAGQGVKELGAEGVVLEDGTVLEADVVVLATGYADMRDTARRVFGSSVADRCGDVWNMDDEGEIRTLWKKSGHPGFWFTGGAFLAGRIHSRYLALQILGELDGLSSS